MFGAKNRKKIRKDRITYVDKSTHTVRSGADYRLRYTKASQGKTEQG